MARYDKLISFLEREAQFLRGRIGTLENKGWPVAAAPGEDEGEPDAVEAELIRDRAKLEEIESHLEDLKRSEKAAGGS